MSDLVTADLFAGGGGTSTGLAQACKELSKTPELTAVNHWDIAIETHKRNHPWARHLLTGLDQTHPTTLFPKGRIDLLAASPECIHHSNARGGKPMCDQSRSHPWLVMKWLQDLYVPSVLIENVPEMLEWGPLGADGRPLKSKRGQTFKAWTDALKTMGYNVEYRILNTADYGDATVRKRFFLQAKRGKNKKIYWPEKTHSETPEQGSLFGAGTQKWKAAREIIDWTLPSRSIFSRKKPLATTTLERIAAGLQKFGGANAEPFLVILRNHMAGRSLDLPLPTMTAGGTHIGLCEPFIATAGGATGQGRNPRSIDRPMPTVMTESHFGVVEPMVMHLNRNNDAMRSVNQPMQTVTATSADFGLIQPLLMTMEHGGRMRDVDRPMPTITKADGFGVVQPFITTVNHGKGDTRCYSQDRPLPTVTGVDAWAVIEPLILKYYGTGQCHPVSQPLDTITTRDRFGLIEFAPGMYLDIHFRMLSYRELANATGFPEDYWFAGTREDKVAQIGNAVPVKTARQLITTMLQ